MRDSLVALNIVSENKTLLNNTNVPILYYWDGENSIKENILNDVEFKHFLFSKIANINYYSNTSIYYFYFHYNDNNEENYTEDILLVQDLFKLNDLPDDKKIFYKEYLLNHFKFLYESAYHETYSEDISIIGIDDAILDIYDKIQEKYPKRVIKSTVINYIRSELQKTDNLTMNNTDWIILQLENLLNERI